MKHWIKEIIDRNIELLKILESSGYISVLEDAGKLIAQALEAGNKIILAGNGGSAADAQHFAGEMTGRFIMERESLPAISLCVDSSAVTGIANDYGYEKVFARQIEGIGHRGDVFVAISTSGNSENLLHAAKKSRQKGLKTIGLLGMDGGRLKTLCDLALVVPSDSTPRIQEVHALSVHLLCEMVERELFS